MSSSFDPFARPQSGYSRQRQTQSENGQRLPTMDDYRALLTAYQELQTRYEQQVKALHEKSTELQVKNEVLTKQSADIKGIETELVVTRGALQQTQAKLDEIEQEKDDDLSWQERYQRLKAESENRRKRLERRYADEVVEKRNRILLDMLPLADHLDMALKHIETTNTVSYNGASEGDPVHAIVSNIEATRRAFLETLKRYGINRLECQGQPFDPNMHEAIGQAEDDEIPADHITQVIQAGYAEGEKLVRPARVLVSKGRSSSAVAQNL